jgi:hypothetical protein
VPICKACGQEADELVTARIAGKSKKACEECADAARETEAVAEESEAVVQRMMDFKGRR